MGFADLVGLVRIAGAGVKVCGECTRLEALVLSERNRGNDLLHLLNESNQRIEVEREAYNLLEERFLLAIGAIRKEQAEVVTVTDGLGHTHSFGGIETLSSKQRRLGLASIKRRDEKKAQTS